MISLSKLVAGLAVALLTSTLPLVAPASEGQKEDNLPVAVRTTKSKTSKTTTKVVRKSGHELVSLSKMEELQEGTHKITKVQKHLVYVKLVKSKVVSLQLQTPEGKMVVMKTSTTEQIESTSTTTTKKSSKKLAHKKPTPSKGAEGDNVFFSYKSTTLKLSIHFPKTSCDENVLSGKRTEKTESTEKSERTEETERDDR